MENDYIVPKIWSMKDENGGQWASINRPDSGARFDKALPVGVHPIQLYSMGTPNGQKVTILLEELLNLGVEGAQYDAHLISISDGHQFGSGFVDINPNSKIPVLVDNSQVPVINVFESGSILLYLADKFGHFLPKETKQRTAVMNWLFWLQGAAPYLGGGFGHFYSYAPEKLEYPINRFTMEAKRQLDVLDKQLAKNTYIAGEQYSIADMAIWPWYGNLVLGKLYNASEFLDVTSYSNVQRWAKELFNRKALQRGCMVNKTWGEAWEQVPERHCAKDIDDAINKKP